MIVDSPQLAKAIQQTLEGGMGSGQTALTIRPNKCAYAENVTVRRGGRPIFTRMADEDHRRQCFLRGIGTLVQLFAYGLHKIPRGHGSSKGADDGHLPTINALIWSARFDKWMHL